MLYALSLMFMFTLLAFVFSTLKEMLYAFLYLAY